VYSTDTISADTTLYAKWTGGSSSGELYVSFDTMGGSGIATQVVAAGGLVTQPFMYPDKTGYVFVGWYKETNGITAWNFASDTVSAATTIYAKWAVTPLTCRTNSGIEISKCLTSVNGHLNIPNYIAGKPVVRIGKYAFEACVNLRSVSFPPFLHTIAEAGFGGAGLRSVVVPECVTELAVWAFADCSDLTNIVLPNGLMKVGTMAFGGCWALPSIAIPETVTEISAYAFEKCYALTNFVFPEEVIIVSSRIFNDCTNLRSVTWPTNCKSINLEAFKNCKSLTAFSVPQSVTNIGGNAFLGCTGLKALNMYPVVAPTLGVNVFYNVTGCALRYPATGSGYGVNPWIDTAIFSSASADL